MRQWKEKFEQTELTVLEQQTIESLSKMVSRLLWQAEQLKYVIAYANRNQTLKGTSDMVAMTFNSQQFTPQYGGGSGGLPANPDGTPCDYKVVIVDSAQNNVEKNGMVTGGYLSFELTPIEGPLAGTKHTDRLNLHNTNPKTVEIANKQLSAYCHVLGKFQFNDTAELHNIPFIVRIGLQKEPNENKYTEVKAIFDINGNEAGKAGAGPQAQQTQAPPPSAPPAGVQASSGGWGGQAPAAQQQQSQWGGQQQQQAQTQTQAPPPPAQWGAPPAQQQQQQTSQQQTSQQQQWGAQPQASTTPPGWGAPPQ